MHVGRVNFIVLLRHMRKIGQIRDVLEEDANVKWLIIRKVSRKMAPISR